MTKLIKFSFVGLKPKPATTSKYTLNVNKENKKFSPSSRVKKTVRTPSRIAGSKGELSVVPVSRRF